MGFFLTCMCINFKLNKALKIKAVGFEEIKLYFSNINQTIEAGVGMSMENLK